VTQRTAESESAAAHPPDTVAIIGLGLVGGSLARDLAARGYRVLAADRDHQALAAATDEGVIAATFHLGAGRREADGSDAGAQPATDSRSVAAGPVADSHGAGSATDSRSAAAGSAAEFLAGASLVVIATPVCVSPGVLRWLAGVTSPATIITDTGSTKRSIMTAAATAGVAHRFVGSHPMAGDHHSGWGAAREGLFADAPVWLCTARAGDVVAATATGPDATGPGAAGPDATGPGAAGTEATCTGAAGPDATGTAAACTAAPGRALAAVQALWLGVGARPCVIDADEHDHLVAWSSHLPQLVSSTLARALQAAGVDPSRLGRGGRDATRLAASDPGMWRDIVLDNADAVVPALDALLDELARLRSHVVGRDAAAVSGVLAAARDWARSGT
jgi:prephenate dehydrogenase